MWSANIALCCDECGKITTEASLPAAYLLGWKLSESDRSCYCAACAVRVID